ncbi:8697_t:CDS:2 [Paraglomus occultum]|uniref:8697_t:CDS:1 n=1 Tax=Paraglomus occultum TaxID=144539 RepID=A0A9N9ALF0_9GLOM|nr:8697_t:CDS:2 [Paraglomus occultum]
MEVPDIEICSDNTEVIITQCMFHTNEFQNNEHYDNCTTPEGINYIRPIDSGTTGTFCKLFTTNKTKYFTQSSEDGLFAIEFLFKIMNLTATAENHPTIPTIHIQTYHPDYSLQWKPPPDAPKALLFENDLRKETSAFIGLQNYFTKVILRQSKTRTINHKTFRSVLGLEPQYFDYFAFDVDAKYLLVQPSPTFSPANNTGIFSIEHPKDFSTQEVKEQQRTKTLLSSLGLAGGAFGVSLSLYKVLFGESRLKPCPVQPPTLMLSSSERVVRLENRVQELEELLQECFFDTSYLKQIGSSSFAYKEDEKAVIIDGVQNPFEG